MSDEQSYEFDVAVSFAGEDRQFVKQVVDRLRERGLTAFYDEDYKVELWGQDLVVYFDELYRKRAKYAVVFVSKYYPSPSGSRRGRRRRSRAASGGRRPGGT